jgi:putative transposase
VTSQAYRAAAAFVADSFEVSERRSCLALDFARSSCRYEAQPRSDGELIDRLRELATERPRFGYRRLHVLVSRDGLRVNHKRLYRIYRTEGLSVRRRRRKRVARADRPKLEAAIAPNQRWSMDFVSDTLSDGRPFRNLTIVDDCTRECPAIETDTSLPGLRVIGVLERLAEMRGLPKELVTDNGPEFISKALDQWAYRRGIKLRFIAPGKPTQNAYVESFNGKFRDECLNEHWFTSVPDARRIIESYRIDYNQVRPHSSLEGRTPEEFAAAFATLRPPPAASAPQTPKDQAPAGLSQ